MFFNFVEQIRDKFCFYENFQQFNLCKTFKLGTTRGIHLQINSGSEDRFISCIRGKILDVTVDLRYSSTTLFHHNTVVLSEENRMVNKIPRGFGHAYQCLSRYSECIYLHTGKYDPENSVTLSVSDPVFNIQWPLPNVNMSEKDRSAPNITDIFKGF